jgi:hypothetical protein
MIMIHACEKRQDYVNGFLVPYLVRIGFDKDEILVYVDHGKGNLQAYLDSYRLLPDSGDWWHLEDDVVPDRRFHEWAEGLSHFPGIVCGFGAGQYYGLRDFGYTMEGAEGFLSFPCIRIPCETVKAFLAWLKPQDPRYKRAEKMGKEIDALFKYFLTETDQRPFNFYPCIVEHIDYLLGGSTINENREDDLRAAVFEDLAAVEEVRRWVG